MSRDYELLLDEIARRYTDGLARISLDDMAEQRRIELYWDVGRRIDEAARQSVAVKGLMGRLGTDLATRIGESFSARTVYHLRCFALAWPSGVPTSNLSWSHYRVLLSVGDAAERARLEQQARADNLSRDALQRLLSQLKPSRGELTFLFTPREAAFDIVKVIREDDARPRLDLGFGVTRSPRVFGVKNLVHGEHLKHEGNERFTRIGCESGARYCFRGEVRKVIDGDTVKMRMDLGFDICVDESMRLRGVDAAEIDTEEGLKAHRALQRLLKNTKVLTVFTYSHDRYGRYIADLIADGVYINKAMVDSGAARFLKM